MQHECVFTLGESRNLLEFLRIQKLFYPENRKINQCLLNLFFLEILNNFHINCQWYLKKFCLWNNKLCILLLHKSTYCKLLCLVENPLHQCDMQHLHFGRCFFAKTMRRSMKALMLKKFFAAACFARSFTRSTIFCFAIIRLTACMYLCSQAVLPSRVGSA